MLKRSVGSTGIDVSIVGLGTVKFGRNEGVHYPTSFQLPTDDELDNLLATAAELGINLLDTAPAYGTSEDRLGRLLRGKRHDWVITTKVGEEFIVGKSFFDFSPLAMQKSIERSLKRLGTDYLDIVLVHSNGDDERLICEENVFETLENLKKTGVIRAYGMSTKTVAGGLLTIDYADVAMVTFNSTYQEEREVILQAAQQNKGIFIKKSLASGHLQNISEAMRFIFNEPGVTSVIVGTINPQHLRENVACVVEIISR